MEGSATILIVDDHPLFREGLKAIIGLNREYEVIAEAGTGREGLRLALELCPHVALVDISLPDQSGIQLAAELRRLIPSTAVMMVSVHSGNKYFAGAFQAGAKGYLTKGAVPERLLLGLEIVLKDGFFLDEPVSKEFVQQIAKLSPANRQTNETEGATLTSRQRTVLELLAQGHSHKTIGDMLNISPRTVEKHRAMIASKLGLPARADLGIYAIRKGIIELDSRGT